MSDTGKHSALRQTSDGSFEIVFDSGPGLHEISEDAVSSVVEAIESPEPRPRTGPSKRVLALAAGGIGALVLIASVGWWAMGSESAEDGAVDEVPGFRPYSGGADDTVARAPARKNRAAIAAAAKKLELEEAAEADEAAAEEDEPGWELAEADESGIVVEVEGTDPEPEPGEVVADEVAVDEGPGRIRSIGAQRDLRTFELARDIKMPRVGGLAAQVDGRRFERLPIKNIAPQPIAGAQTQGELADDSGEADGEGQTEDLAAQHDPANHGVPLDESAEEAEDDENYDPDEDPAAYEY